MMRRPTEAEVLQASAIVVAAPRYMGAFASAIGISVLTYWPAFAAIEIGSGAAMAILEGWAVAFMFRKWRIMQPGTIHWWVLLVLQFALMLALPATATPYLLSSQLGQPANQIMPFVLLVAWSFTVAAIAPLVLAAVGYSDTESKIELAKKPEVKPVVLLPIAEPAVIEPVELVPEPASQPTSKPIASFICSECGRNDFKTVQALNAHKGHCKEGYKPAIDIEGTYGRNGNGKARVS